MSIKNLNQANQWCDVQSQNLVFAPVVKDLFVTGNPAMPSNVPIVTRCFKHGDLLKTLTIPAMNFTTTGTLSSFTSTTVLDAAFIPSYPISFAAFANVASVIYPAQCVVNQLGQFIVSFQTSVPNSSNLQIAFGSVSYV